ncbi:hypothetical protein, partial [Pseudoalteromonas spongiae]|uniref:hypothetical protein n=1 Tax=Pseudoalteromonas spongiae TaxID=298657 RepID=UPI00127C138E
GGTLNLNSGTLVIGGDYRIQKPDTANPGKYVHSIGRILMNNTSDYVLVHGDFVMDANYAHASVSANAPLGKLEKGVLEVKGDFTQLSTSHYSPGVYTGNTTSINNFQASGEHKVVLSGDSLQTVHFEDYDGSNFNALVLNNTSDEGVAFIRPLHAKSLKSNDNKIASMSVYSVVLDDDALVLGNLSLGTININGHTLKVKGGANLTSGTVNLASGTLNIQEAVIHSGGTLNLNSGTLVIGGDYRIQKPDTANPGKYVHSIGRILMNN